MLPNFDVFGFIQTSLIGLVGWIGVRIERALARLSEIERSLGILSTRQTEDQKANERRLDHAEDDIRYLTRKHPPKSDE